jgi:very-short-patch-repair endonuclease
MDRLRRNARNLRNEATDAERELWKYLRGRRLEGFRFRRQVPIAGFIADFVCPQAKLIVELDGGQHQQQEEYDAERSRILVVLGYRVLRYWNNAVMQDLESVVADIHRELTKSYTPPQPSPSLREREGVDTP